MTEATSRPLASTRSIDARWSAEETEPAAIADALRKLEMTRRPDGTAVTPGRALTLIVLVELEHDDEIRAQLRALGPNRASRTIIVRRSPERTTIRGRAAVIADDAIGNSLRETVVLDVGPADERDLDGILDPLVLTDVPTVAWAPYGGTDLILSLRALIQAAILDGDAAESVGTALDDTIRLNEAGIRPIDMAWLRSAPWRVRLAALSQTPKSIALLHEIEQLDVSARADSQVCGALFAGWLAERLEWQPGPPLLDAAGERVLVLLHEAEQPVSGLESIALTTRSGHLRRIERASGGLRVIDSRPGQRPQQRTVLGASRGDRGLLPSALRQVLMAGDLDHDVVEMTAALDRARVLVRR